jgi:uncharacterized protein (UPF0276 family)
MISQSVSKMPAIAGIGLRHPHLAEILERRPAAGWLEIHAENYMNDTPASQALDKLRGHFELSVHGVGLSLGSAEGIDRDHLFRLKAVCDRYQPTIVSEHLAWCIGEGVYLNDLLPIPHDEEALAILAHNIDLTQSTLGRQILIENLSTYVDFAQSTMNEAEFLAELVCRTGCGLLLDVNNVYVSAHNIGFDARAWIRSLPGSAIGEIHVAGHCRNHTPDGVVLIDDHGSRVASEVWALYAEATNLFGRRPTLVEWDSGIPSLDVLLGEATRADLIASAEVFHAAA